MILGFQVGGGRIPFYIKLLYKKFNLGHRGSAAHSLVQKCVPIRLAQRAEVVAEHELDGGEEVALAAPVAAHHNIVLGRKVADCGQLLVAAKPSDIHLKIRIFFYENKPYNYYLLDKHIFIDN